MKRIISGALAAIVLLAGGTAFAQTTGLLGEKVTGIFTLVKHDGSKIGEAVVIDGVAYAPVRVIAEASGAKLSVEGKRIIMSSDQASLQNLTEELPQSEPVLEDPQYGAPKKTASDLQALIASQENLLVLANGRLTNLQGVLPALERSAAKGNEISLKSYESAKAEIERLGKSIAEINDKLAEYEAELQSLVP